MKGQRRVRETKMTKTSKVKKCTPACTCGYHHRDCENEIKKSEHKLQNGEAYFNEIKL